MDVSVFEKDRPRIWLPYVLPRLRWPFLTCGVYKGMMPRNWSVNLLIRAEAGQRYTPRIYLGPGEYLSGDYNSEVGPAKNTVNVRINKFWKSGKRGRFSIFAEARNIFNHKNYRRVNPWTGEGYQIGDYNPSWVERWSPEGGPPISTDSEAYTKGVVDPSYIEDPRILMWGVSYSW
jgi:hypothetical protein